LIYFAWRAQSARWRFLAQEHSARGGQAVIARKPIVQVIARDKGLLWTNYYVSIGIAADGLLLRQVPFGLFNPALFLPFADLKSEQTSWFLNAQSHTLTARKAPDLSITLDGETLQWIASHAKGWPPESNRQ
jgi:hypothetical protein